MNLLIIDLRIKSINIILESLNINTTCILLDFDNDTEKSLKSKIDALNISYFETVGIIRIGKYEKYYQLIANQELSWNPLVNFITYLSNNYNIKLFNFISCNLATYPNYTDIFDKLENTLNIKVGASIDLIGNGNWTLERSNVNVKDIYFNDNILNYQYLLDPVLVTPIFYSSDKIYDGTQSAIINYALPGAPGNS